MKTLAYVAMLILVLLGGTWYSFQPTIRVKPEFQGADSTRWDPVPFDSVRFLGSFGGDGCSPFQILARLYVDGRLFSPSTESVQRALRRQAGRLGANAVAYTLPSMEDLPVSGFFERLWEGDEMEAFRHNEKQVGRAAAFRCRVPR